MPIVLDNRSIREDAAVGSLVGNLSVKGGGSGPYTYSLTSNPGGLYQTVGATLRVAAALLAGLDPITLRADGRKGQALISSFTISVTSAPSLTKYVPSFHLLGF